MRHLSALPLLLVLAASALSAASAEADVVTFANGDRISGTVLGLSRGTLRLMTDHCGTVEIEWDKILTLATEKDIRVEFTDRESASGKVAVKDGRLVVQEDPAQPPLPVSPSSVTRMEPPGTRWSGNLTLSIKADDGNDKSTDTFLSGEIVREGDVDKFLAKGQVIYGTEQGLLTDQSAYGRLQYNFNLSREWYLFAGAESQTDKFEDLTVRSVLSAGPGYILSKDDGFELWIDAGPSFIHEVLSTGERETWFGARVGGHILVKLPLGLEVRDDVFFYPNFKRSTNWQLHNDLALSTHLGAGWSLVLTIISDLDHEPAPGKVRLDDVYALGLRFKF